MKRKPLIDVPPWVLPLLVVALTMPIVVAVLTGGPFLGLLMGGLVAAAVVVTAIRLATEPPRRRRKRHSEPRATRR